MECPYIVREFRKLIRKEEFNEREDFLAHMNFKLVAPRIHLKKLRAWVFIVNFVP